MTRPFQAILREPKLGASLVFLVALLWQAGVLGRFGDSPHFLPSSDDMKFYNDWALRIAKGEFTDGRAFYGLPGYAYCLAAIYAVVGFDPFIVGAIQTLLFSAIAVVIFLIGTEVGRSTKGWFARENESGVAVGLVAAVGWILFVPAQAFSVILMPTAWAVLAYWGLALWFIRSGTEHSWKVWLSVGVLIGAVAMMVATVLFAVPLGLAAILYSLRLSRSSGGVWRRGLVAAIALLGGVVIGTAPAWLHNRIIAKEPVLLSAHSGINLWIGNNPIANGYPKIPPGIRASQEGLLRDSVTLAERAVGRPLKRYEVSRYWTEKANAWIREDRERWLRLLLLKLQNVFNALQYDDLSTIKLLETSGVLLPGIRFGLIAAFGIPGLLVAAARNPKARWVAAAVALHVCAIMPVFVTERYRLAIAPGLIIGSAYALWCIFNVLSRSKRWIVIGGWVAAIAASTTLVTLPRGEPGVWSLDHYKAGIRALELGEMERAKLELETAYAYVPEGAEINFALANYWYSAKQPDRAKIFYRRALELDPRHSGAFNNLGVIMLEEKRWDWAEKFLLRAIAIDPADAKTHYLLARAQYSAGKLEEAESSIARARALRPQQTEFSQLQDEIGNKRAEK